MMRSVVLDVALPFSTAEDRDASEHILITLLGFCSLINLRYLDRHKVPRLYDSGVRYAPPDQMTRPPVDPVKLRQLRALLTSMGQEPEVLDMVERLLRGVEIFLDVPALYKRGKGDCNELAPVRVAELWQAGVDASPHLIKERSGLGWSYHAAVLHPDGSSEDPSLILGMGGPARTTDRAEEIRKNAERYVNYATDGMLIAEDSGFPAAVLGKQMSLLGLLPRDGVFRVGGPPIDLLGRARRAQMGGHRGYHRFPLRRAA